MADITITAASVAARSDTTTHNGTAGATITAGQSVYLDSADGLYKLTDANSATAAAHVVAGIALHPSVVGQPLKIATGGTITIGGTVAVGSVYVASATPGGIAPDVDAVSGWFKSVIGVAITTGVLKLIMCNAEVAVP